jgi:hypothetical protein
MFKGGNGSPEKLLKPGEEVLVLVLVELGLHI